jgi:hypothetical protein
MRANLTAAALVLGLAASPATAADPPVHNYYVPTDKTPWIQEDPNVPVELAPLWGNRA